MFRRLEKVVGPPLTNEAKRTIRLLSKRRVATNLTKLCHHHRSGERAVFSQCTDAEKLAHQLVTLVGTGLGRVEERRDFDQPSGSNAKSLFALRYHAIPDSGFFHLPFISFNALS